MHRDVSDGRQLNVDNRKVVTHLAITKKTEFIITASQDGHVKFWKKQPTGVEFVKHFRAHVAAVHGIVCSSDGKILCSISADQTFKLYDILNYGE